MTRPAPDGTTAESSNSLADRRAAGPPKFIYFDLGRVVVDFDGLLMCRRMAQAAGVDPERVRQLMFHEGLVERYELGELNDRSFYDAFCRATQSKPDYDALLHACADIFALKLDTIPIVAQLSQAGHRLGILSNTCQSHWEHCLRRYRIVAEAFEIHALSYLIGHRKPDAAIYQAAAALAGHSPADIFFVDDLPENVQGAFAAGLDAVQFTTAADLATVLRKRGVRFNY